MRFLLTGITGFAGTHLTERLLADGHEVYGVTRRLPAPAAHRVRLPKLALDHLSVATLSDGPRLAEVVRQVRPDGLFHLAALTSVAASFADPQETYRANLFGSLNVFAAVRDSAPRCRIVWVGSSEAYGQVEADELPVTETKLFRPLSPYAVSKAAADLAAYQWSRAHGLDIVRLRPFNSTGPGQTPQFVCSDFARQIIAVERGTQLARIEVGNLDAVRDFSDVRDVVHAYILAWERGQAGEAYNVCSGIARTPRDVLQTLMRVSGVPATVAVQAERQRPVDVPVLVGSAAKLRAATGWSPAVSWEQTLRDLLADWRDRLAAAGGSSRAANSADT